MRKIAVAAIALTCVAMLAGCASRQFGDVRVNNEQILREIQTEQLTKKAVWIKLGQPHRVTYSESNPEQSIWRYFDLSAKRSGVDWIPVIGLFAGGENVRVTENVIYFEGDRTCKAEKNRYELFKNDWAAIFQYKYTDELDEKSLRVKEEMEKLNIPFDPARAINVKNIEVYVNGENSVTE